MKIGKPSVKNLSAPRPRILKVIGDTCIYAGTLVTGMSIALDQKIIAYCSLGLSISGFFFTNLYKAQVDPNYGQDLKDEPEGEEPKQ